MSDEREEVNDQTIGDATGTFGGLPDELSVVGMSMLEDERSRLERFAKAFYSDEPEPTDEQLDRIASDMDRVELDADGWPTVKRITNRPVTIDIAKYGGDEGRAA